MDRLYKPHFLQQVKQAMANRFPDFVRHSVPGNHPQRELFSGDLLYRAPVSTGATVWLRWTPGPGVERYFNVYLGWSPEPNHLPQHHTQDFRLYSLSAPSPEYVAASLDLEQIEGKAGIGGITIPSPWDQILTVKAAAPRREQQAIQNKAFAEAQALSDDDRANAVTATIDDVCKRVQAQLPAFTDPLRVISQGA